VDFTIEEMTEEDHLEMRSWRYPPPFDFYDGDVDPPLNPERYFATRDADAGLVGFYYFEEKPPDLDYGLGLRPDLVGRGLGLGFFRAASSSRASATGPASSTCTSPSSTSGRGRSTSAPASSSSRGTSAASSASGRCRS
jgi:hypothetical protein